MGGCCSSSRRADKDTTPAYYYCPPVPEERGPVDFANVASTEASSGLFFDKNLDTSVPDVYQAPPAPMPYDDLACSYALPGKIGKFGMKTGQIQPMDSPSVGQVVVEEENLNGSECKSKVIDEQDSFKLVEDEPSKLKEYNVLATEEDDVCPTCLEEYDSENPRIITKCEHHFHLSCIYEWMERSETCPICDQIMMFDMDFE